MSIQKQLGLKYSYNKEGDKQQSHEQIWINKNRINDESRDLPSKRRKTTKENICDDTNCPNIDFEAITKKKMTKITTIQQFQLNYFKTKVFLVHVYEVASTRNSRVVQCRNLVKFTVSFSLCLDLVFHTNFSRECKNILYALNQDKSSKRQSKHIP